MMSVFPLVTCYILTYNSFEGIYRAIDCILHQDYPKIEIAIFDDGSNSFPGKEISEYIYKNKNTNIDNVVVVHSKENQGTVKNINSMVEKTNGEYYCGISADDRLYDERVVSDVVAFFMNNNSFLVSTYSERVKKNGEVVSTLPTPKQAKRWNDMTSREQYRWIAIGAPIAGPGLFYSRKVFDEIGCFDENYFLQEDGPFLLKATRAGYHVDFYERKAFIYELGEGVSSGRSIHPRLKQDIELMFKKEIDPYMDWFSKHERRCIAYEKERLEYNKQLSFADKFKLSLRYFDIMLIRFLHI